MKRFLRIGSVVLLALAAGGLLTWYFLMRRTVPDQARCIPKNAIAVLTLNVRELALDHAAGTHLFPGMEKAENIPGALQPFIRAIEQNDGSGLNERADVLGFLCQAGDAAYLGIAAKMSDREKFSRLILDRISRDYPLEKIPAGELTLVRFDSTSAVIGWNDETALFLFPFSNHGGEDAARECTRLLQQQPDASVLSDENFCNHELASFDAGLWIHAGPLLHFTSGGKLARIAFRNVDYLAFHLDFRKGETDIRRIATLKGTAQPVVSGIAGLPCDPKQVNGFWQLPLDLQNDSLLNAYIDSPPLSALPLSHEEARQLAPLLDGSSLLLLHDTISYEMPYIGYRYDDDFNQVADTLYKKQNAFAMTYCFGLKDEQKAKALISEWMRADSIPQENEAWQLTDNGLRARLLFSGKTLVLTYWPGCDGKPRPLPAEWSGYEMNFDAGDYLGKSGLLDFLMKDLGGTYALLSRHIGKLTILQPVPAGNQRASEIRLRMSNEEVNALVQLEDIFRKGISQ